MRISRQNLETAIKKTLNNFDSVNSILVKVDSVNPSLLMIFTHTQTELVGDQLTPTCRIAYLPYRLI